MQGFIIKVTRSRDEDLIVTIITQQNLQTLYRFYGARHSPINLGFKIDFETESSLNASIARLRDVIHLGYPWILDRFRLSIWQQFIALFHAHLYDAEEIGSFYFDMLERAASHWHLQNPRRIAVECYVSMLRHEGRLHDEMHCFYCDTPIMENISLLRAFLPAHHECSHRQSIALEGYAHLIQTGSTLFLSDSEVDTLWYTVIEGF